MVMRSTALRCHWVARTRIQRPKRKHASHLKHTLGEMCALTEADEGSATILVGQHGRLCIDSLAPSPQLEVLLRCPWQGVRDIPANRTACSKRIARTWLPGITERLSPQRQPGGLGGMSVPRGAKPPERPPDDAGCRCDLGGLWEAEDFIEYPGQTTFPCTPQLSPPPTWAH